MTTRSKSILSKTTLAAALSCLLLATTAGEAANRQQQRRDAERLVAEALQRQIYGMASEAEKLLAQARDLAADFAPAQWHSGHVLYNRRWLDPAAVAEIAKDSAKLNRYTARRSKSPDTVEGQWELAMWCRREGLLDEQRAHLTRVLELSPNHAEARAALGFVRSGSEWLSTEEIKRNETREKARAASLMDWEPKIEKLAHNIDVGGLKQRNYSIARLEEIRDPAAVSALESVLARHSESSAELLVKLLSNINDSEASLALARLSVFSNWEKVRTAASTALKSRPLEEYVPAVLAAMSMPARTRAEIVQSPNGRLTYNHVVEREVQQGRRQTVAVTEYRRQAAPGGDPRETLNRALGDVQQRAVAREQFVAAENLQAEQLNKRVLDCLTIATDAYLVPLPTVWWTWWNEHNELYVAEDKPLSIDIRVQRVVVQDRPITGLVQNPGGGGGVTTGSSTGFDCLARGTQVWTETGMKNIEKIRIGDRVLSQNPDTGELAYKPVLRTTVRPAGPLVQLDLSGESIRTSSGHLFWVAGDGWVKARHVKSGGVLCGASGPVPVSCVEHQGNEQTYNLVVADFNTYFVGRNKVLCHDNTLRRPTKAVVPGLAAD